jgi:hypothetical protein
MLPIRNYYLFLFFTYFSYTLANKNTLHFTKQIRDADMQASTVLHPSYSKNMTRE